MRKGAQGMSQATANLKQSAQTPELAEQEELALRRQLTRAELYGLAILIGQGLAAVYVLGTLVLDCIRS